MPASAKHSEDMEVKPSLRRSLLLYGKLSSNRRSCGYAFIEIERSKDRTLLGSSRRAVRRKICDALFIGDVTGPSKTLRRASGYDKVDEQTDRHDRAEDKTEYHE